MKRRSAALWFALAGLGLGVSGLAEGARKSIKAEDLRRQVEYLSDDALEGRETGERGVRRAEKFIAREFKKSGLDPLPGRDDFFVDFTLYRVGYDASGTQLTVDVGGKPKKTRLGTDFRPFGFSDEGSAEAPVVFAGYGITAPEHGYDDYDGLDVEGKIVLILRHEPGEADPDSPFDGTESTAHSTFTTKASNASEHGAVGMLLVTDPLHHGPDEDLRVGGALRLNLPEADAEDSDEGDLFLALHIGRSLAATIVSSTDRLEQMQRALDDNTPASALGLEHAVSARLNVRRSDDPEPVTARNVAAIIEGRDPELKDEWVVIGGHHDHIGGFSGRGDTVYNGADDNASGTSGVLALARAFASRSERPRRSIVFVTFSGEEKGLLGSRALVEQELIPIDRVVFMLNLDMIGRNPDRNIELFGDGFAKGLRGIVDAANADVGLELEYGGASYAGNSDHDPFYESDIPFMFFFTGVHEDYHQLGDHAEKLDYGRMESILRVAYGIIDRVAELDEPPGFIHHITWLGVQVEVMNGTKRPLAVVTVVDEDSRAAEAGLQAGDVLAAFDGNELDDADAVGARFRAIDPGTQVALRVRRGSALVTLEVERAKVGYLGVFPGSLDDDVRKDLGLGNDEGLVLNSVVADGPAGQAGLREGDIVVRLSGRPLGMMNLRRRLAQIGAGETVDVMIIRDGERTTLPLTLGERPRRR